MSLLVVAHSDNSLPMVCQAVGLFLSHRRDEGAHDQGHEPLLGIWMDPSPLDTVTVLSQGGTGARTGEPWVRESFGQEGEWYVCWLAGDVGPQGELETLDGLLNLLLEAGKPGNVDTDEAFAPCFPHSTPDSEIRGILGRLAVRFPDTLTQALTQDPVTARLVPQPYLGAARPD
ncbi:MAG TPA: hypothetical protein VKA48_04985 [Gammaproteobacteria bacterium]|nr:hypothetical protein [Gammaproteobacteria bacterium]